MGWNLAAAALATAAAVFILRWSAGTVIGALGHPVAAIVGLTMLVFFLPSFFAGIPAPVLAKVRSEEHTSELQSLMRISYAVFCLTTKNIICILDMLRHKTHLRHHQPV